MEINIGPYPNITGPRDIKIKIDKYDTWSLDHTLALIIYPALLQLKDNMPGIPADFTEDLDFSNQYSFDFYNETELENNRFQQRVDKWNETLDKMIWAFREIAEDTYEEKYQHGEPDYEMIDNNDGTSGLEQRNKDAWTDYNGIKAHEEKIDEGLMLFAKYFRNLWE